MKKITIRLPDDLHAKVIAAADADRRSVNNELLALIERALDERDKECP